LVDESGAEIPPPYTCGKAVHAVDVLDEMTGTFCSVFGYQYLIIRSNV